jgi:transcription elongation factor GreA
MRASHSRGPPVKAPAGARAGLLWVLAVPDVFLMSQQDYDELEAEIERLETVERSEIAERIRTAREWGDLKENSEYHDAKNDQSMLETKILRLRERLLRARIHTGDTGGDTIGFGSQVTVIDEASGRELGYTLVAAVSADPAAGKLSIDSPVGKALTGAREGDVVSVGTPKGDRRLKVTSVG